MQVFDVSVSKLVGILQESQNTVDLITSAQSKIVVHSKHDVYGNLNNYKDRVFEYFYSSCHYTDLVDYYSTMQDFGAHEIYEGI